MEEKMTTDTSDNGESNVAHRADGDVAELSRRQIIKLGAAAAIAASLPATEAAGRTIQTTAAAKKAPLFFTPAEFALVDELSELIIPADDHSPGARAAEVTAYIDFTLSESWEEKPKTDWREGLKLIEQISQEMHGKPFLQSAGEERIALLTRISQNEKKPEKPEQVFFKELKSRTAHAYYTSEIGIKKEMEYKGNTYLKEFVGYDATYR
jgi:gluconate 2-dehydrogenase gamma chain